MDWSVSDDVTSGHTVAVQRRSSPAPSVVVAEWMSGGVIAVVVLGGLCLVLGLVYAYIYFTHINPRAGRTAAGRSSRKNHSQQADDGASVGVSTHVFLFKKS